MSTDSTTTPLKRCTKCGIEYPATTEYFRLHGQKRGGLNPSCKVCGKAYDTAHRVVKSDRLTKAQLAELDRLGLRRCFRCRELFPATLEYFYRRKSDPKGLGQYCKPCGSKDAQLWKANNPEKAKASQKRRNAEYPDGQRRRYKKWLANNGERERERLRLKDRANPEAKRARSENRRARLEQAEGEHSAQDIAELYELQNGLCGYCGMRLYWNLARDIHVDHISPVSRGGSNFPENLLLTCSKCNLSKYDHTLEEWRRIRGW